MPKRNQNIILNSSAQEIGKQIQLLRELLSVHFKDEIGKNYHIRALDSHLILSSSVGSLVKISGSLSFSGSQNSVTGTLNIDPSIDFSSNNTSYHIRSLNSHLILSSSVGSHSTFSSSLSIMGSASIGLTIAQPQCQVYVTSSAHSHYLIMRGRGTAVGFGHGLVGGLNTLELLTADSSLTNLRTAMLFRGGNDVNDIELFAGTSGSEINYVLFNGTTRAVDLRNAALNYHIRSFDSHLILSSSAGSTVAVSGNLFVVGATSLGGVLASQIDLQGGANYHLRHTAGHLILSSSAGSVVALSGVLKIHSFTNAQKDALTPTAGMMIYNTTSGSFQVYTTAWKIMSVT